jgi:hypothetical protein
MKSNAYKRPDLKKKTINRLSMNNSNKLFNGDHIDDVMDTLPKEDYKKSLKIP